MLVLRRDREKETLGGRISKSIYIVYILKKREIIRAGKKRKRQRSKRYVRG